jgi:hypothetical protein
MSVANLFTKIKIQNLTSIEYNVYFYYFGYFVQHCVTEL